MSVILTYRKKAITQNDATLENSAWNEMESMAKIIKKTKRERPETDYDYHWKYPALAT